VRVPKKIAMAQKQGIDNRSLDLHRIKAELSDRSLLAIWDLYEPAAFL
jgi:hypothetical protein